MTENAIQYDRNKDRQGLFKEEFFRQSYQNNLWLLNVALEGMHEFPTSPPETVVDSLYVLTIAEYTAGYPIEIVRDRFAQAIEYSRLCLAIDEKYPVDDPELIEEGWTMSVWGGGASGRDFLVNAIGLCLLFEQADWLEIVKRCYELDGFIDTSFNALINMVIPMDFDPKAKFRRGGYNFRKPLLQAIMAESKEETLKHLNAYLAGWYDGNRKIGNPLIDTHLEQDPEYGGYIGNWSFESAAVAYLKDLDDTSLRQYMYYPKDMVDWAREQKLKREQEQDGSDNLPLLFNAGMPAPFSGRYGINNFIGHEIQIKQGELLPAGQVSAKRDKNGNPIFREDTVWRLLKREDKGKVRFSEKEVEELQK